jgi:hypothetical protein
MIVISLLGVDQFQAQAFVKDLQDEAAQVFETSPEEILFYAPDSFLLYRGVDQTSYQLNIVVQAPHKYEPLEDQAANWLIKVFTQNHVHVHIVFEYFEPEHEHDSVNPDYPRFMSEDNMAHFEANEEEDEDTKPYMGNVFEGFDEKVKAKEQEQAEDEKKRQAGRAK